ncbi:glycosyl hydrolase family 88 [Flavobacterium araucananum]|nr:glycosyl hydrolase family 88 [Flavobacterium araucananum]
MITNRTKVYSVTMMLVGLIFFLVGKINAQEVTTKEIVISKELKWSERMALSIVKRAPKAWQVDGNEKPKWDYKLGLVTLAFQELYKKTNNPVYGNYVKEYAETVINGSGEIMNYKLEDYNIDYINAGKILFDLYKTTNDKRYLTALQTLRKQLATHPRTNSGGFWHKKIYPYQMWLDGLYMGAPFYAQYTAQFDQGKDLDDVAKQFE